MGNVCNLRVEQLSSLYLRKDRSDSSGERRTTQRRVLEERDKEIRSLTINIKLKNV